VCGEGTVADRFQDEGRIGGEPGTFRQPASMTQVQVEREVRDAWQSTPSSLHPAWRRTTRDFLRREDRAVAVEGDRAGLRGRVPGGSGDVALQDERSRQEQTPDPERRQLVGSQGGEKGSEHEQDQSAQEHVELHGAPTVARECPGQ